MAGGSKAPSNVGKELRKSRQLLMDIEKVQNNYMLGFVTCVRLVLILI